MSLFNRILMGLNGSSLPAPSRPGQGLFAALIPTLIATDANLTLTVAQMSAGMVQFTGFTAGRNVTTPTAALINAAAPEMDIGDSFSFFVSVVPAFAATYVAGAGVTLQGRATTPASSWSLITVTKTGAATFTWNVS